MEMVEMVVCMIGLPLLNVVDAPKVIRESSIENPRKLNK
jgi:hypothetical protein